MNEREEIIKNYFQSWINNNCEILKDIFDSKVIYSECYGPEYRGINVIERWFMDWNVGLLLKEISLEEINRGNYIVIE